MRVATRRFGQTVGIAIGLAVLIGGGVALGPRLFRGDPKPAPIAVSKYTQTWPKAYATTDCRDWLTKMTPAQRFAGASDLLAAARKRTAGATRLPPDARITDFGRDVSLGCTADIGGSVHLLDVANGIYETTGHAKYKP